MAVTYKGGFNLNDLSFETVIGALNKYFANDKRDTSFIEVRKNGVVYRVSADDLIAWLRTKHGIFYYPGMEAKYAKAEKRVPPFSERMKNDGALHTLKKLHKIVTGEEASDKADSPTLIAAAIENDFAVLKQDLKNALEAKESFFETKGKLSYCKELMGYIATAEKKYGICFSDLHDDKESRPERIFDDLLHKMTRNEHILKDLYRDILHEQPDGLSNEDIATKILDKMFEIKDRLDHKEAEVVGEIGIKHSEYAGSLARNTERSDINQLISDFCTKNDVTPPSPYFSDESSIKYLFSVVDLERKHRAVVGKQMVDDYEKDLLRFIYKTYADRTRLGDETITYNPPNICNTITKIISDYTISRTRIDTLERRIKHIYDTYKTMFTVDDYVINGDPTISFMLDCIRFWVGSSSELKHECDFLKDELGKEAVIREFLDRRRKTQTKLGTIEKKLEDILKDVKEELP